MKKIKKFLHELGGDFTMSGTRRMQAPGNLQRGKNVKGSRAPHLEDQENNFEEMLPKVAVAFLNNKYGKVLAVSRGNDLTDMNMPGGGVESGEESIDAAVRELWEETGLRAEELFPIFSQVRNGQVVTAFRVTLYHGELSPSNEGFPSWEDPEVLMSSSKGDFFKEMLDSFSGGSLPESISVRKKQ